MNRYHLREIADAIRYVEGSTELINASDFPDRIKNLNNYLLNIDDLYIYCIQRKHDRIDNILNINDVINGLSLSCIRDYAFYQCSNLTLTSLPESVTSIGAYAFYQCSNLTLTSLPESVTSIGAYAFWTCNSIEYMVFPTTINEILYCSFGGCVGLKNVKLGAYMHPADNVIISSNIFFGCTNLTSMTIYTVGGLPLSDAPFGATNATITYIDSTIG